MSHWNAEKDHQQTADTHDGRPRGELAERNRSNLWTATSQRSTPGQGTASRGQAAHSERHVEAAEYPARHAESEKPSSNKGSVQGTNPSVDYALLYGDGPGDNLLPRLSAAPKSESQSATAAHEQPSYKDPAHKGPSTHEPEQKESGADHSPKHGGGGGGGGGGGSGGSGGKGGNGAGGSGGGDGGGEEAGGGGGGGSPGGGGGGSGGGAGGGSSGGAAGGSGGTGGAGGAGGKANQSAAAAPAPLPAAETAQQTVEQFAAATPTQMAHSYQGLGGQLTAAVAKEAAATSKEIPELTAKLEDDGGDPKESAPLQVTSQQSALETTPKPAEKSAPPTKTDPGKAHKPALPQLSPTAEGKVSAGQIEQGLRGIRTEDGNISVTPSPKPSLKDKGSIDPKQADQNQQKAATEVNAKTSAALLAISRGPGPMQVQPQKLEEKHKVALQSQAKAYETVALEGHKKYLALGLPADVQASFDELHGAKMTASLASAKAKMDAAHQERDQRRDAEIKGVQQKVQQQNQEAQRKQSDAVQAGRATIKKEREQTESKYKHEQDKFLTDSQKKSEGASRSIKSRIAQDQQQIDQAFQQAETEAQQHVQDGEKKAADAKKDSEEESKQKSWWDRAIGFIKDAISALTSLISDIFDAVRKLVAKVLDAAKELACKLIDAATAFIQDALTALGEALKTMVNVLIGGIFPELAQQLNDAIDKTVTAAKATVQKIAEDLKQKVCALIDELKSALDGILAFFQSAVTTVLSIVKAVMSGDWKEVVKLALEAALKLAGIDPAEFYATVGSVETVLSSILEQPGAFIGNLISAAVQGFQQFGKNFGKHLEAGFVSWLTGVSGQAGIPMPIELSPKGVFNLITGVLDLNWTSIKGMLLESVRKKGVAGEKVAEKFSAAEALAAQVEAIWTKVQELASGGWAGLWQYVAEYVGGLTDTVLASVKDFLVQRVVMAAISKLATMWNPVGAIVQALMTAWNMYQWFKENMQRIMGVVRAVFGTVGQIVQGNLSGAANGVEKALGGLVAPAIELLASILGLGGLGGQVREVIGKVRTQLHGLLQKVSDKLVNTFWSLAEKVLSKLRGDRSHSTEQQSELGHPTVPAESPATSGRAADRSDGTNSSSTSLQLDESSAYGHSISAPFTMSGHSHQILITEGPQSRVEMASRKDRLSYKIGREIGKLFEAKSKQPQQQSILEDRIAAMKSLHRQLLTVEMALRNSQKVTDADAVKLAELASAYGQQYSTTEIGEAEEIGKNGDVPESWDLATMDPFQHPAWKEFTRMCAEMNPPIAQTVAAELWCQIMVGMGLSTAASKQWKPMDHMNRSTSAKGEQDNVFMSASRTVISNAVKRLLNGYFGKKSPTASYALWSGGGAAREFAQRQGHTVLEGTQAGALFDTLANTLNTPPVSKWGIVKVLWEELSRMYARQCSLDQVDGYLRSADPSSIFARIEFETLRARAQAAGKKLNIKLHAIGAETKTSDDRSVTVDELKILGSSTNLPGVAAYIERNDSLIRRNKVVGQAASLEDPAVGN